MEAHLAPMQLTQVNKITSSCEICSGPHDTQYCMENPEQAFIDYASSRTDGTGSRQFTMNQGPRNFNEAANTWKGKATLKVKIQAQRADSIKIEKITRLPTHTPSVTPETLKPTMMHRVLMISMISPTVYRTPQRNLNEQSHLRKIRRRSCLRCPTRWKCSNT
ncbi:hypothetical protein Tco_0736076 [Tanacetum coccineum]